MIDVSWEVIMLSHSRRPFAFTIVELLVVCSLITLLISMLLPNLSAGRDNARLAKCLSNQRELTIATSNYVTEKFYYPVGIDHHADNSQRIWLWPTQLRMYTDGNQDLFMCPKAPESTRWVYKEALGEPAFYGYKPNEMRIRGYSHKFSYGYNVWGAFMAQVPNTGLGVYRNDPDRDATKAERVRNPSNMIAFADSNINDYWSGYIGPYRGPGQWPARAHLGKSAVAFCDNSARTMERADLVEAHRAEVNIRWNNDARVHPGAVSNDGVPDYVP